MGRKNSDERYILDLCDSLLGLTSLRQYRFNFLRGDGNRPRMLPVDAYYPNLNLVIEYHERQHSEPVKLFDNKPTVSGVPRGIQRQIYDQRRAELLPKNNIDLLVVSFLDFETTKSKKLARNETADCRVLQKILGKHLQVLGRLTARTPHTSCRTLACLDGRG